MRQTISSWEEKGSKQGVHHKQPTTCMSVGEETNNDGESNSESTHRTQLTVGGVTRKAIPMPQARISMILNNNNDGNHEGPKSQETVQRGMPVFEMEATNKEVLNAQSTDFAMMDGNEDLIPCSESTFTNEAFSKAGYGSNTTQSEPAH
ncbi:hypothetical protein ACOSQ4_007027 [Xanthoceras sorbifolium]